MWLVWWIHLIQLSLSNYQKAITVCRKNRLSTELSLNFLKNLSAIYQLDYSYFTQHDTVNYVSNKKHFSDLRRYAKYEPAYLMFRNITSLEDMEAMGTTIKDMLVNCLFNGIKCDHTDWTYMFNRVFIVIVINQKRFHAWLSIVSITWNPIWG